MSEFQVQVFTSSFPHPIPFDLIIIILVNLMFLSYFSNFPLQFVVFLLYLLSFSVLSLSYYYDFSWRFSLFSSLTFFFSSLHGPVFSLWHNFGLSIQPSSTNPPSKLLTFSQCLSSELLTSDFLYFLNHPHRHLYSATLYLSTLLPPLALHSFVNLLLIC